MTPKPLGSTSFGIPGYSAETTNDDIDRVTAPPAPSPGGIDNSSSGQASSTASPSKQCACIVCLEIGFCYSNIGQPHCRFARCAWTTKNNSWWEARGLAHERTHYQRGPINSQTPFSCLGENCRYRSKRWSDLRRHTTAKHCNDPAKFACSVIGCKYNGDGNGFTRKDKLTDHYKNMHQGQRPRGQAARPIMLAQASSYAEASGSA